MSTSKNNHGLNFEAAGIEDHNAMLSNINMAKNSESVTPLSQQVVQENKQYQHGDRFIPCRSMSTKYELQYQHEEHLLLNMKGGATRHER